MACAAGPDIKEDGLVLALDAANYKSFKGEGTTNIVPNADVMSGWSPYSSGNDGTFTTEFGTTGYRIINRPSWNGIYQGITLPSTGTYTLSAWFRYWGGSADNNGATVYTNGGGIGDVAASLDKSKVGVWQRVTMTQTYSTTGIIFYIISYGGTNAVSTWDVTMPQIEAKSYATTFTTGTRGTTVATGGGWADLSANGNNGELVNGVRENSNNLGSLTFDGVDDYVTATNTLLIHRTSNWTYSCWVYFSGTPGLGTIFENGSWTSCLLIRFETNGITIYSMSTYWGKFTLTPTLGIWYKLDFIRNGNSIDFYLNGVYSQSLSFTADIQPSSNLFIGMSQHSAGQCFNGRIAQTQIYNRALSAQEIQQNFNATRSRYGI